MPAAFLLHEVPCYIFAAAWLCWRRHAAWEVDTRCHGVAAAAATRGIVSMMPRHALLLRVFALPPLRAAARPTASPRLISLTPHYADAALRHFFATYAI